MGPPPTVPHPLLFCPLPLNTTAQWLSRTRWAVGVCVWRVGGKLWHLGPPQITRGTNWKMMRIKTLIIPEIRWLLWTHSGMDLCTVQMIFQVAYNAMLKYKCWWKMHGSLSHSLSRSLCIILKWRSEAVWVSKIRCPTRKAHLVFQRGISNSNNVSNWVGVALSLSQWNYSV